MAGSQPAKAISLTVPAGLTSIEPFPSATTYVTAVQCFEVDGSVLAVLKAIDAAMLAKGYRQADASLSFRQGLKSGSWNLQYSSPGADMAADYPDMYDSVSVQGWDTGQDPDAGAVVSPAPGDEQYFKDRPRGIFISVFDMAVQ